MPETLDDAAEDTTGEAAAKCTGERPCGCQFRAAHRPDGRADPRADGSAPSGTLDGAVSGSSPVDVRLAQGVLVHSPSLAGGYLRLGGEPDDLQDRQGHRPGYGAVAENGVDFLD